MYGPTFFFVVVLYIYLGGGGGRGLGKKQKLKYGLGVKLARRPKNWPDIIIQLIITKTYMQKRTSLGSYGATTCCGRRG